MVTGKRQRTARILIIEDNVEVATLLQSVLGSLDYQVEVADDLSALAASRVHLPDLILLDLMMPAMSGDDAARYLRETPETRDIPIVLVSSAHDLRERAAQLDVSGYLRKPFDLDELLNVIDGALPPTSDSQLTGRL